MLQSGSMSSSNNSWSTEEEKDMANRFPLHRACRDGNLVELRDLLGQLQANIHNSKLITAEDDKYRWTAAHFSAYFGRVECLRLLMQAVSVYNPERSRHNLDPISCPLNTTTSSCSQTPLHVAAFANHPRCVEWLLQSGAHIHTQDSSGETALHKACRSGAREVLKVLATYKADCTTRNAKGLTAAEVAAASGHTDIAELITGTPTQSQAPLVSTNGYYGYQPPSVKGAPDLLASEAVAKDLIAVAGRKRGREEEDNCSNKRGRYQAPLAPPVEAKDPIQQRPVLSNITNSQQQGPPPLAVVLPTTVNAKIIALPDLLSDTPSKKFNKKANAKKIVRFEIPHSETTLVRDVDFSEMPPEPMDDDDGDRMRSVYLSEAAELHYHTHGTGDYESFVIT